MTTVTRLEKTFYRLQAQILSLNWAFEQIEQTPGVILEIGLGLGRTYQYIRTHLPEREIIVFERNVHSYDACTPPSADIITGDIFSTLVSNAYRFKNNTALVHSDLGSFDKAANRKKSALLSQNLSPYLTENAIVLSDLPLDLKGCTALDLPGDVPKDSYYIYKKTGN